MYGDYSVHCPSCSFDDTKVIDSRVSEEGTAVRRRRSCLRCEYRFTTYERLEELPLVVVKRGGDRQPFNRQKMMAGMLAAVKGRSVDEAQIELIAERIEDSFRQRGTEVTSNDVGLAVLDELRVLDEVAYMRFASVYKNFDDAADFRRELALLEKHANSERAQRT
ncbi:MAG: transcriptional repressor NrdR [Actinomycetota bacterium]